jgi:hypothetical protein
MTAYRIYTIDAGNHIVSAAEIECDSDADACAEARQKLRQPYPAVEVWEGARKVVRIQQSATSTTQKT